jgi:DNA-binding transcriptional MocR family regulator
MSTTDYRGFVERLAASITGGELRPGTRMAPVRQFAYANGIAASTASRVYAELTRRGLINGEVGRGTFVRSSPNMPVFPEPERPGIIDLEINAPAVPGQAEALAVCLADLLRSDRLSQAMRPIGAYGHAAARQGTAQFLRSSGWVPSPDHLLFAGSGRQGIAAALSACAVPGERIGLEALTYPAVKAIIGRLGLQPVALAMDEEGVLPDAIEAARRRVGSQPGYFG